MRFPLQRQAQTLYGCREQPNKYSDLVVRELKAQNFLSRRVDDTYSNTRLGGEVTELAHAAERCSCAFVRERWRSSGESALASLCYCGSKVIASRGLIDSVNGEWVEVREYLTCVTLMQRSGVHIHITYLCHTT